MLEERPLFVAVDVSVGRVRVRVLGGSIFRIIIVIVIVIVMMIQMSLMTLLPHEMGRVRV
jgi:hypothetical protein